MNPRDADTNLGGTERALPTTLWSDILALKNASEDEYRLRFDRLLRIYWKPIYAYIRASWRKSSEDAKDLTQAFFAYLLERKYLSNLQPGVGTFRGYLKIALKHFLIDCGRHERVCRPALPVESFILEGAREVVSDPEESPERALDRQWTRCLIDAGLRELESELVREGKQVYFEVIRKYLLEPERLSATEVGEETPEDGLTYAAVAAKVGVSESDVRNYLANCRQRLKSILWRHVRESVANEEDIAPELISLLRGEP